MLNLTLTLLLVSEKFDDLNELEIPLESGMSNVEKNDVLKKQGRLTAYFRFLFLMLMVMVAAPKAEANDDDEAKPIFLHYLLPNHSNFAPNAKRYEEPRKGQFGEIPLVPESQQPFLWQCDELDDDESERTPSPVFEAAREVRTSFNSKVAEIKTRHRQLEKLKELIDTYHSAQGVSADFRKKLQRLRKIYKENADITEADMETWENLEQRARALRGDVRAQVFAEKNVGTRLRRCTKTQSAFDIGDNIHPSIPPLHINFKSYTDEGVSILPFRCEAMHPTDLTKTSSRVYIAVSILEQIITEHILIATEREKDYITATDRATGEVGNSPVKIQRRNALNALKSGSPLNASILNGRPHSALRGWISLLSDVRKLKAEVYRAVRFQTKAADKIDRCKRPDKRMPTRPSARDTKALKKAVAENDVMAIKVELRRQLLKREKISDDQISQVFIALADDMDIRALDRKKRAIGQRAREQFQGQELTYHILEKRLQNGTIVACVLVKPKYLIRACEITNGSDTEDLITCTGGMEPESDDYEECTEATVGSGNFTCTKNPPEADDAPEVPDPFSSRELVKTINDYRKQMGLPEVVMSPALNKVAQQHVKDLAENKPQEEGKDCNLHSWSDQTEHASECCYTSNHAQAACMWNKPRELTGYDGNGYEIAAGGVSSPEEALSEWMTSTMHHAVIINRGLWKDVEWNAMGAAVYKGYAVVWFGKEEDAKKVAEVKQVKTKQEEAVETETADSALAEINQLFGKVSLKKLKKTAKMISGKGYHTDIDKDTREEVIARMLDWLGQHFGGGDKEGGHEVIFIVLRYLQGKTTKADRARIKSIYGHRIR